MLFESIWCLVKIMRTPILDFDLNCLEYFLVHGSQTFRTQTGKEPWPDSAYQTVKMWNNVTTPPIPSWHNLYWNVAAAHSQMWCALISCPDRVTPLWWSYSAVRPWNPLASLPTAPRGPTSSSQCCMWWYEYACSDKWRQTSSWLWSMARAQWSPVLLLYSFALWVCNGFNAYSDLDAWEWYSLSLPETFSIYLGGFMSL